MQQSSNPGSLSNESSVNTHHEVLSVTQKPQQGLLNHLQSGLPNPMDLILDGIAAPQKSVLNNVAVQPKEIKLAPPTQVTAGSVLLEEDRRLSECYLWTIMENYYRNQGINAWQSGVPMFITNSAYIAESYAEMVLAFLEDYYEHLNHDEPLYIVELATGTGRFSHLLLRELERKLPCFSKFQNLNIKYVMTDFTDKNPQFWEAHDKFKPYVEKGMLDFAVLNPLLSNTIELRNSKQTLTQDTIKNPMIVIANYFFDTIPHDVFRIESKVLKEGLVTLERKIEGIDPNSPVEIAQVKATYKYQELYNTNYYEDSRLNNVLNYYRHTVKNGTILFPLGALTVLSNLQQLANNQLVIMSSDKSYTTAQDMIMHYQHEYTIHDGCFSFMMNFDAVGQFFKQDGGSYFHTTAKNHSVQTICCVQMNPPDCKFERLKYLYQEKMNRSNPINSVCSIMPNKKSEHPIAQLTVALAQLQLNLADPHIFACYGQSLVDIAASGLDSQRKDLLTLMEQAWNQYYYYPGESNLPFWLSQLYFVLGQYDQSLECLDHAIALFGEHEVLRFMRGQNYDKLKQYSAARAEYQKAVQIRNEFPEAWECLTALDSKIAD